MDCPDGTKFFSSLLCALCVPGEDIIKKKLKPTRMKWVMVHAGGREMKLREEWHRKNFFSLLLLLLLLNLVKITKTLPLYNFS
jgi:hypothetical protein